MSGFVFSEKHRFPDILPSLFAVARGHVLGLSSLYAREVLPNLMDMDIRMAKRLLGHHSMNEAQALVGRESPRNFFLRQLFATSLECVERVYTWKNLCLRWGICSSCLNERMAFFLGSAPKAKEGLINMSFCALNKDEDRKAVFQAISEMGQAATASGLASRPQSTCLCCSGFFHGTCGLSSIQRGVTL